MSALRFGCKFSTRTRVIRKLRMQRMDVRVLQIYEQASVGNKISTRTGAQQEFCFTLMDAIFKYS